MAGAFSRGPFSSGETAVRCLSTVEELDCKSVTVACLVDVSKSADPRANEFDSTLGAFPAKNKLEARSFEVICLFKNPVVELLYAEKSDPSELVEAGELKLLFCLRGFKFV